MTHPVLALFERSLRADARGGRAYLVRFAVAGAAMPALFSAQVSAGSFGAPGLRFFSGLAYTDVFLIALAAIGIFAPSIAEEKEEGTLALLRLSGLTPLSILLGKTAGLLLGTVLLLAAQFPFALLAAPLGGVSGRQVVAVYAALAAFLVFTAGLGALCSTLASRGRDAVAATTVLLLLIAIVQ